jgi:hypothetical protein
MTQGGHDRFAGDAIANRTALAATFDHPVRHPSLLRRRTRRMRLFPTEGLGMLEQVVGTLSAWSGNTSRLL